MKNSNMKVRDRTRTLAIKHNIIFSLFIILAIFVPQRAALAQSLFDQGEHYRLSTSYENNVRFMAISGSDIHNGGDVILWNNEGQDDIRWLVHHVGGSNYKIQNRKSGRYLAVSGGGTHAGANVIQWVDAGQRDVIWEIATVRGREGLYTLRNTNSGLYLAVSGGQIRNGAKVIQWENNGQHDIFWRISKAPGIVQTIGTVGKSRDFGYLSSPNITTIPLLLILTEFRDSRLDRPESFYDNLIFGPAYPNIGDLFQRLSNNKFNFTKVDTIKLTFDFPMSSAPADFDVRSIRRAFQAGGIDPGRFDRNNDGTVTDRELAILSINANLPSGAFPGGQTRGTRSFRYADTNIAVNISSTHNGGDINLYAHELYHYIDSRAGHIYGPTGGVNSQGSFFARHYRQASSPGPIFLDAFNRIRSGWVEPRVFYPTSIKSGAWVSSSTNADQAFSPIILHRSVDNDTQEYFVLEHRRTDNQYDAGGVGNGLAVWYVQTDENHNLVDFSWPPPFSGGAVPSGTHIFSSFMVGTSGFGRGGLWNSDNGVTSLRWGNGTDSGIRLEVKEQYSDMLYVEWWTE